MFKNLKLGYKFIFSLLLISVIPLAVISIFNYYYSKSQLEAQTRADLLAINNSRATHINHLVQLRQEQAKQLAGSFTARQLSETGTNEARVIITLQDNIESIYRELKERPRSDYADIDRISAIDNISVWDLYGTIIANTDRALIGRKMPFEFLHILHDKGAYFMGFRRDPITKEVSLTILEGIRNWKSNEYAGVVLLKSSAEVLNDITATRDDTSESTETYIIDRERRMITESRFVDDAVLSLAVNTVGSDACFAEQEVPRVYKNYQGRLVYGAHRYLSDQQWCVITEIGADEVLNTIIVFRKQISVLFGLLIVLILVFVWKADRAFIIPVVTLHHKALEIAKGNYDIDIVAEGKDEIGELSRAFVQMAHILSFTTSELKQKNEILEEQKAELKKFDQRKSEFVSMVSHELRTPMTVIKESIEQVTDEQHPVSDTTRNKLLGMAMNNIDRLVRLINNLLDLSKIEAGKIELHRENVNIVALATEVSNNFVPQAMKRKLEVRRRFSADEIIISIDKEKIIEVFTNLIGNSLKFVTEGYVEVSVIDEGERVRCVVADTGHGIAKDDLQYVFGKYHQVGNKKAAKQKGTGLGLSISKALVELHGGNIWVESTVDKGTQFIFTLPKAGAENDPKKK